MITPSTQTLINAIKTLINREFVNRVKKINPDAKLKVNRNQYVYSLTKQGQEVLNSIRSGEYRIKKSPSINQEKKQKIKIGKNQLAMLNILKEKPLFLTEIFPLVNHLNSNIGRIRDGLLRLIRNGTVSRKKEFNSKSSSNVKYRYKFSISNKGIDLLKYCVL